MAGLTYSWQTAWRVGFAPQFSVAQLAALRQALIADDPALMQGCNSSPPPMACVQDWPVEGACVLGYCGWRGLGLKTVGEVEEFFARTCFEADQRLQEPAGCHWFLNWFDETPRDNMRRSLLAEVEAEIARREGGN